jgi:hypothetical protein
MTALKCAEEHVPSNGAPGVPALLRSASRHATVKARSDTDTDRGGMRHHGLIKAGQAVSALLEIFRQPIRGRALSVPDRHELPPAVSEVFVAASRFGPRYALVEAPVSIREPVVRPVAFAYTIAKRIYPSRV